MTQREQGRLQVLNNLLAEHMTLDQVVTLLGVSPRHTLAAYQEKGATAAAHGHRGRKPVNATSEPVATAVVHLAHTKYSGTNHTHLSEFRQRMPRENFVGFRGMASDTMPSSRKHRE